MKRKFQKNVKQPAACLSTMFLILLTLNLCSLKNAGSEIQLIYYGHSCFEIDFAGKRIIIDPFTPEWFDYERPKGKINYGFASHAAEDHSYFDGLRIENIFIASGQVAEFEFRQGNKISRIKGKFTVNIGEDIFTFWTVPSFHDEVQGAQNGVNGIICFDFNGLKVVHLGDLGHRLEEKQIDLIGDVDVLMIPVDSYYIIELEIARGIVKKLSPSVVIPMHYKTDRSHNDAKAEDLNEFIKMFDNVKKQNGSMIRIHEIDLNAEPYLLLMEYKKKGIDFILI